MSVRIPWSIDEAVIMLDMLLAVRESRIPRQKAIPLVSAKLRKLAVKKGLQIDEVFRNANGIALQMSAMEYVLTDGATGLNKPTKLFQNVVELYKYDKETFKRKVREVNALIDEPEPTMENQFKNWLNKRVPPGQINEFMNCYAEIEKYCLKTKVLRAPLFETTSLITMRRVEQTLKESILFQLLHRRQMKTIFSAVTYYIDFLKTFAEFPATSNESTDPTSEVSKESSRFLNLHPSLESEQKCNMDNTNSYEEVLKEYFARGFRLNSALDMKKFRHYYEVLTGNSLDESDSLIESAVQKHGIIHEGKVFSPETVLSNDIKETLFNYIDQLFALGKTCIYYEALFQKFSDFFLDSYIYDVSMLKSYLNYYNNGNYYFEEAFFTKESNAVIDNKAEVCTCLIEHSGPMSAEQLSQELLHIPWTVVSSILNANSEFVYNGKYNGQEEYFHADVMDLSDSELDNIAELISSTIRVHHYISKTELLNAIKAKYPDIYESYPGYSDLGWRDALKYKFAGRFSFQGNIISIPGDTLSMRDVFGDLARSSDPLTLGELQNFADEMGSQIYFNAVYDNALRINETTFVSREHAQFQIKDTDSVIDRFCTGNYIPIKAIQEFSVFPDAGFPWTCYLLECYTAYYSEKYTLLHNGGYNQYSAVGAIVKKTAGYNAFDDLIVDRLAASAIPLKKAEALELLVQEGYIARRSYANIEKLLIRAKEKRNGKG